MRALLKLLAALAVLAVAAIVLVPLLVPAELVKRQVELAVEDATGRQLTIAGDVRISVFPVLAARIGEVRLANAPGARTPDMAQMRELDAQIALVPLLSGRIEIARFILRAPVINLEILPNGRANWDFAPPKSAAPAQSGAGGAPSGGAEEAAGPAGLTVGELRIEDGRITYADRRSGTAQMVEDVDLSLSLPDVEGPLEVAGALTWNGERVSVSAWLARARALLSGGRTEARLALAAAPVTVDYEGALTRGDVLAAAGQVEIVSPSVRRLAAWTGNPLAPGGGFGPLSLEGRLESAGNRHRFSDVRLSLDGSRATGDLTLMTGGARPKVTGRLDVDQIDTNVYTGEGDGGWSTERIDLSGLRAIDAQLALSVGEIIFGNIVTGASALDLGLENGRLVAALTRLALYEGSGKGRLVLNGRTATPSLAADFTLDGLQLDPFLNAALGFKRLRGTGAFRIDVTASGASQDEMVRNLNGSGAIDFRNGAIKGINLAQIIRTALTNPVTGWANATTKDTDFSELSASFRIAKGILTSNDLKLVGPLLRLTGAGTVSIVARTLDIRLKPKFVASLEGQGGSDAAGLDVPVRITGSWSNPRFAPDVQAVLENPQETLETIEKLQKLQPKDIIRGLLGQPAGPDTAPPSGGEPAPAPNAPAQKEPSPEELIRGLFGR